MICSMRRTAVNCGNSSGCAVAHWCETSDEKNANCEYGMAHLKNRGVQEVMRANWSKLGGDGQPLFREDVKILKGPNYRGPELASIVNGG